MTSPFLGEVRAFGFNFAPSGWQQCNGQILQISTNQALFSLLGTQYGGNGIQTFALPDLRGRIALSVSTAYTQGQALGTEGVALTTDELPKHGHQVAVTANGNTGATNVPSSAVILGSGSTSQQGNPATNIYGTTPANIQLAPVGIAGSSQPHENRMPSLVMNYCIAMLGLYPSRS